VTDKAALAMATPDTGKKRFSSVMPIKISTITNEHVFFYHVKSRQVRGLMAIAGT
jgi:hypothetical protein